jgi:3-dehydroquinate dehydratase II
MRTVLVIHGSNLNLLGLREPEAYGTATLGDVNAAIERHAAELGFEVEIHQTQYEGKIIELLHDGIDAVLGAVINPGGYCHTSRAIEDAIRAVPYPVVEVHMTNIHARHPGPISFTATAAVGVIAGFRTTSYLLGLDALRALVDGDSGSDATGSTGA